MKVEDLIALLLKMPCGTEVRLAFESGIRMDVEVAELAQDEGKQVVVLTDKEEWENRDHWYGYC